MMRVYLTALSIAVGLGLSGLAISQQEGDQQREGGEQSRWQDKSEMDTMPEPPRVRMQDKDAPAVRRHAGAGGSIAYSSAGVMELGGSLSLSSATNFLKLGLQPTVGYFFADNFQVTGLLGYSFIETTDEDGTVSSSNFGSLLVEPSFHMPMSDTTFAFAGLGLGSLFMEGDSPGLALAPRIGYKQLVGRSGLLTCSLAVLIGLNESDVQTLSGEVLQVDSATNLEIGYTILL